MDLNTDKPRTHCIRCGGCCLGSSPTLQKEDVPLVKEGLIQKNQLFTIRAGELVHDNVSKDLKITNTEMLKVRERENGRGCIFYRDREKACTIYHRRPAQCRALACWDTSEFMRVHAGPKAERKDVVEDAVLKNLIMAHNKRCAYDRLEDVVLRIEKEGERAVEEIMRVLKWDHDLRPLASEKLRIESDESDFYFGRPMTRTIKMFGLQVRREPDGSFFLTTSENA